MKKCENCEFGYCQCVECDGSGEEYCGECGNHRDCLDCYGSGELECVDCCGVGEFDEEEEEEEEVTV